jgi:ammonia channel protein AmtB
LIGAVAIILWSLVPTFFFFLAFQKMSIFRMGEIMELVGLDYVERESLH